LSDNVGIAACRGNHLRRHRHDAARGV